MNKAESHKTQRIVNKAKEITTRKELYQRFVLTW